MRVEPPRKFIQDWSDGLADMGKVIPVQYITWAYSYLGYDDPLILPGDIMLNGDVVKLTEACILRLRGFDGQ